MYTNAHHLHDIPNFILKDNFCITVWSVAMKIWLTLSGVKMDKLLLYCTYVCNILCGLCTYGMLCYSDESH